MYQVIKTKYFGPTNYRGSRVKASCEAGSVTINWADNLDVVNNHMLAIKTLHVNLGWNEATDLVYGWDNYSLVGVQVRRKNV